MKKADKERLYKVAQHLFEGLELYVSAANEDAGCRNKLVENSIKDAIEAVNNQRFK